MKKLYAICRTEKIKAWSSLGKSVGHNLRTSNDTRSHLAKNHSEPIRVLTGDPAWEKDWRKQVKSMWLPGLKQGDRHTLAREFFLGASPEYFENKTPAQVVQWAEANVEWLRERFGADRVKLAVLHLDEQSPHIAAYIVPLKADTNRAGVVNTTRGNGWTLSDQAIGLGGSSACLVKLQDDYAAAMKRFGLERGEPGSKAEHQTIKQWLKQLNAELPKITYHAPEAPKPRDFLNIKAYAKRVAKAAALSVYGQMKTAYTQAKRIPDLERQIKRQAGMIDHLTMARDGLKRALAAILGTEASLDSVEGLEALKTAVIAAKSARQTHENQSRTQNSPACVDANGQKPAKPATGHALPRVTQIHQNSAEKHRPKRGLGPV